MTIANEYDVRVALSTKKQAAFGTRLIDGSLTVAYPTSAANPAELTPEFKTDADEVGRGHEWETRQDLEYWDLKKKLSFDLSAWMAGWAGAFGLGAVSTARLLALGAVVQTGIGQGDVTAAGPVTPGSAEKDFVVKICAGGASFDWSNDGGATWEATGVAITGAAQALEDGISVAFGHTTGYTEGDEFAFSTTNTAYYRHTCKFSDPATVGAQNPVTTLVEDKSGVKKYFPDCAVAAVELAGKQKDRPTLTVDVAGSGRSEDATAFSMPALSVASFLRVSGLTFQLGPSGALVDESARLKDFSVKVDNALMLDDGYVAGGGEYRSRLRYGANRKVSLALTLERVGSTEWDALVNQTELKAVFTFANGSHRLEVTFEKLLLKGAAIAYDAKRETVKIEPTLLYNSGDGGPVKWVVDTTAAAFLDAE